MAKVHGPRIKAARGYAGGISTGELGSRIGVSESTVKRWEKGDPSLTVGYRIAIADVCGVPPAFMETGWGVLEPGQLERLLDQQAEVLEQIRAAVLRDETDEHLRRRGRAVVDGQAEETPDRPQVPAQPSSEAK